MMIFRQAHDDWLNIYVMLHIRFKREVNQRLAKRIDRIIVEIDNNKNIDVRFLCEIAARIRAKKRASAYHHRYCAARSHSPE